MSLRSFILLLPLFFGSGLSLAAQNLPDSLKKSIINADAPSEKNKLLSEALKKYKLEQKFAEKILKEVKTSKDEEQIARAYKNLALAYRKQKLHENSKLHFQNALAVYEKQKNKEAEILELKYQIAYSNYLQYKFEMASEQIMEIINLAEKRNDTLKQAESVYLLSEIFYFRQKYKEATKYNRKAQALFKSAKGEAGKFKTTNQFGLIAHRTGKLDTALHYFQQCLDIAEAQADSGSLAITYNNIAMIRFEKGEQENYLEAMDKSLEINKKLGRQVNIATAYNNLGYFYNYNKNYDKGIELLKKSIEISKELRHSGLRALSYSNLANAYDSLGDYRNAYLYQSKYANLKDSVFSDKNEKQLSEMNAKYDAQQKEKEIALLKKDKQMQRYFSYFLGIAVVLILISAFIFYNRYRLKKKANKILTNKNAEIEQQKEEILSQQEELLTINDELQNMNAQLEKLSIVARETDNAVIIMLPDGKPEWVNEGFTRLYGYTFQEFKARYNSIFDADKSGRVKAHINKCLENKQSADYESEITTKNQETKFLQTNIVPIFGKENRIKKFALLETDISRIKQAEKSIIKQHKLLEKKNEHINSSIKYARTIQAAMLPDLNNFSQFSEPAVIYKPKDIVSGDFYWFSETKEHYFSGVIDCTGHGVPGAFMASIGYSALNEIVHASGILSPAAILEKLDERVSKILKQRSSGNQDGMVAGILRISKKNKNGKYKAMISGAKQDSYYYDAGKKELFRLRGARKSIAGNLQSNNTQEFENFTFETSEGDVVYLLSDGYKDQNNPDRIRFGTNNLINLLENIADKNISEQKNILLQNIDDYAQGQKFRDDITVLALKISSK